MTIEINMGIYLYFFIIIFLAVMVENVRPVQAVLPPDFIFNIGTQVFQIFFIIFTLVSSSLGIVFLYFRKRFLKLKHHFLVKTFYIIFSVLIVFCLSVLVTFLYSEYRQGAEYNKWLQKSECYMGSPDNGLNSFKDKVNIKFGKVNNNFAYLPNYFGSEINEEKNDNVVKFIYSYYKMVNDGAYEYAYILSDKKISLTEYKDYYSQVSRIDFDNLVRIDDIRSSLELKLFRGNEFEKYDVLLTLSLKEDGTPKEIKDIHSVLIENGSLVLNDFFEKNYVENITINIDDLNKIINSEREDYVIVDIREEFEYDLQGDNNINDLPNSIQIRMPDLMMGRWLEIPKDRYVYVFCGYGNLRSEKAVDLLRSKNILAFYLEGGLVGNKRTDDGFESYFSGNKITAKSMDILSTDDVLREIKEEDTFIVSSNLYIKGFDFYVNYEMTSSEIDNVLNRIPDNSRIILVCHDTVNCSTNQMIWLDIEKRGHSIIGLYNSPWEWEGK